jgi:hypothetical protein
LDAQRWRTHVSLAARDFRVGVVASSSVTFDMTALVASARCVDEPAHGMNIVLDGELHSRGPRDRIVRPGQVCFEGQLVPMERWQGERFRTLYLRYPSRATYFGALGRPARERVRAVADSIEHAPIDVAVASVVDLWDALEAEGLAPPPRPALVIDPDLQRTADALSRLLGGLDAQPMLVDVTEDARQWRRELHRMEAATGLTAPGWGASLAGWRNRLQYQRLSSAVAFLSVRDASVADVARAVGLGSSRALGVALDQAGLASATTIREQLRR